MKSDIEKWVYVISFDSLDFEFLADLPEPDVFYDSYEEAESWLGMYGFDAFVEDGFISYSKRSSKYPGSIVYASILET